LRNLKVIHLNFCRIFIQEVKGTETEMLGAVRKIRDTIKDWLLNPAENTINFNTLIER
jgi:hypothetical protein